MKILIIDDDSAQRKVLTHWLNAMGFETQAAQDGLTGLEAYSSFRPDIVLLDTMMPGIDGLETARRLRAGSSSWTPIIFISVNSEPADISRAIEAGGDDYLIKPVNKIVLAAKIMAMQRIVDMKTIMASRLPAYIDQELQRLTELDSPTGLLNRPGIRRGLAREYARCIRSSQPISAIVARVNLWPVISEDVPHWLAKVAVTFKSHIIRAPDLLAHLDDGMFCAILPDTPLSSALHLVHKVNACLIEFCGVDIPRGVPMRFGVVTHMPEAAKEHASLLEAAGLALDRAEQEQSVFASVDQTSGVRLTPRELECLQWCALGKSTWETAKLLAVSEAAVNFHITNIRAKFNVRTRQQAVRQALRLGLIRQEPFTPPPHTHISKC